MQRPEGMRRNASEQGTALLGAEHVRERRGGKYGGCAEPGQHQWVVRDPQQRAHDVLVERVESRRRVAESALPPRAVATEAGRGLLNRAVQHAGAAAVEWVDTVDIRPAPCEAVAFQVEFADERRADGHRVDRRAVVVQQAGNDGFAAAGTSADLVGRLEDSDRNTFGGQRYGGSEPVGPASYHHCRAHLRRSFSSLRSASSPARLMPALRDRVPGPSGQPGCCRTGTIPR